MAKDPRLQAGLEAKEAVEFIKSLPADHYKPIRELGEI